MIFFRFEFSKLPFPLNFVVKFDGGIGGHSGVNCCSKNDKAMLEYNLL